MCFSESASWFAYIVSWIGVIVLILRHAHPGAWVLGAFFLWVIHMQLWDGLLWRESQMDRDPCVCNVPVSRAAMVVNHAQPLVLFLLCATTLTAVRSYGLPVVFATLLAYLWVVVPYSLEFWSLGEEGASEVNESGVLVWQWNYRDGNRDVYILFLAALALVTWAYFQSWLPTAAVLGSFVASWWIYRDHKHIGSVWCFIAAFLPWLFAVSPARYSQ